MIENTSNPVDEGKFCQNLFGLTGKTALVTGASQGIGHAIATYMSAAGANVAIVANDNLAQLRLIAESLKHEGRATWAFSADLLEIEKIPALFEEIVDTSRGIDILINCAGTTVREPAEKICLEDWERVLRLNLSAVFALSQAFARERIRSQKAGRIINIGSLMCEGARPSTAAYAASKGGIRQLTKALAVDWAKYQITVNAIGPGYVRTPFTDLLAADPSFDAWVRTRTPLGRWGLPQDIAAAAVFLASDAASFITGQILYVDGGWLAAF